MSTGSPGHEAALISQSAESSFAQTTIERLFELSPDAILITDGNGLVRAANPRTLEMFGYSSEELIGQPVEMLIPARFRDAHPSHRENYSAHPRARQMGADLNLFGLRKDGSEVPLDIMLKPVETEEGLTVVAFIRDATEQRAAQEALRLKDLRFRSIVESISEYAVYLLDVDGNVVTWNPGAERIKGYKTEEILGLHFSRFFTEEDIKRGHPTQLLRRAAWQQRVEEEAWRVRKDGTRFWANTILTAIRDSTGKVTAYSEVTRDVTESKKAQEAVILQLSTAMPANVDIAKLLKAVSVTMQQTVPHDAATLALLDEKSGKLHSQFISTADNIVGAAREAQLDASASPAGQAFRTRQPLILNRIALWPFSSVQSLIELGLRSGLWVPLIHRERTLGTLAVFSRQEGTFTQQDAHRLSQLAAQVSMAVNNALSFKQMSDTRERLDQEKKYLESEIIELHFDDIVGKSPSLRTVLNQISTVAPTNATVLIQGETGTGKELLARAIHRLSPRSGRTFIKLNCAAIPAGLIESELFGHEKGAFTGAIARKIGRLELAHEGTLFLDEIGELSIDLQPKLLRALQEHEIERVGGSKPIPVNVRLIAATNRDLAQMVADKQFRSDLFYRLKVFPVFSPPLRDRISDIPILVRHFVDRHSRRMGKTIETIPDEAMEALIRWKWPGNIRELENFLERAVILSRGPVLHVPLTELEDIDEEENEAEAVSSNPTLRAAERDHILRALREAKGMIGGPTGAAARLGLKRTTLNSKMKKLNIQRSDYM